MNLSKQTLIFLILVVIFIFPVSLNAQLSRVEKKIVTYVDQHNAEALELLEEVVNINSGSMNFDGVKKIGQIFINELDALAMETRWVDGKSFQRSGHLIAEKKGKGPTLLLIGHLDTVFEPDSPFQQFKILNDTIAQGPGIADMKGGDVIMVKALEALKEV